MNKSLDTIDTETARLLERGQQLLDGAAFKALMADEAFIDGMARLMCASPVAPERYLELSAWCKAVTCFVMAALED